MGKNWRDFLKQKEVYFAIITLEDGSTEEYEKVLSCFKEVFEEFGEDAVLISLEAFDSVTFFAQEILVLWEMCNREPKEFYKAIANLKAGKISPVDFREHVFHLTSFTGLVPIEDLPEEKLQPEILS